MAEILDLPFKRASASFPCIGLYFTFIIVFHCFVTREESIGH